MKNELGLLSISKFEWKGVSLELEYLMMELLATCLMKLSTGFAMAGSLGVRTYPRVLKVNYLRIHFNPNGLRMIGITSGETSEKSKITLLKFSFTLKPARFNLTSPLII
jgi:hypothetical protein